LGLSLEQLEPVLDFEVKAKQGYEGFALTVPKRFPYAYLGMENSPNTKLVSPIKGDVSLGSTEVFEIVSRDFSGFAIIIGGRYYSFQRQSTGNFRLEFTIPDLDEFIIYGARGGSYTGLLKYKVVK
jgi:hypothetical protein